VSYITFENVTKEYRTGGERVLAANNVSFVMEKGELCVVLGPSGAGKTTILNLLGGMDKATSGRITVGGKEITGMRSRELTEYRRLDVGFVFQFYNLMPNLTALENVELARQVCPNALDPVEVMQQVGLGERMSNFPAQLSGGEQQRVSIARALCKNTGVPERMLVPLGGYSYCLISRGVDLRELGKALNAALCGRGGGKPNAQQGSVKATKFQIEAFFTDK